jgi:predicted TIM-barrel fold metal-dependent hydrolase
MRSTSEPPRLIDVDFWPRKVTARDLAPFLDEAWRTWLRLDEGLPRQALPESQYFVPGPELAEAAAAEDPLAHARARLDAEGLDLAIVNPGGASSVSGYANAALAAEMARAVNEWTVATWLDADERFRGSIVVSPRDPQRAAAEIRRAGADRRMAQVLLSYPQRPLGSRTLDPIYEAACELGVPVLLEAGGAYSGSNRGLTAIGNPATVFETLVGWEHGGQPHLLSAVTQGLFDRFAGLRLVLSGFGVAWLPSLVWRLDREYRLRRVPPPASLQRLPSELVADHVRFTTAVLELPEAPEQLTALLAPLGGDRLLVHGSGPLGAADARGYLGALDAESASLVGRENALQAYRLAAATAA